mmetsp:Transcript_13891/g.21659  ORF Transcript_13891/g.21659 Transcript_13891/m.21659 type:complete len:115 (-) Transcript_13891:115-459(-)
MLSKEPLEQLKAKVTANPDVVKKIKAVFEWQITGANGKTSWTMDFKNGVSIGEGAPSGKPDCVIVITDENLAKMLKGEVTSQALFMQGKMKIKGGLQHALKLGEIQKLLARSKL